MKRQSYNHTGIHKNFIRLEFFRAFTPEAAAKLRQILDDKKAKERGK